MQKQQETKEVASLTGTRAGEMHGKDLRDRDPVQYFLLQRYERFRKSFTCATQVSVFIISRRSLYLFDPGMSVQ